MKRCVLLIPLTYNDGSEVPAEVMTRLFDRLYELFGAYSIAGTVKGAYRMEDGTRADDICQEVWIAADEAGIEQLRKEASRIAGILKQETIYFEVTDSTVEFIPPAKAGWDEW